MKAFALAMLLAAASAPAGSLAQNAPASPPTKQEDKGLTGWTGGAPEQEKATTTGAGQPTRDEDRAADQPAMATGSDLKGPPVKFPPNKTPE